MDISQIIGIAMLSIIFAAIFIGYTMVMIYDGGTFWEIVVMWLVIIGFLAFIFTACYLAAGN